MKEIERKVEFGDVIASAQVRELPDRSYLIDRVYLTKGAVPAGSLKPLDYSYASLQEVDDVLLAIATSAG